MGFAVLDCDRRFHDGFYDAFLAISSCYKLKFQIQVELYPTILTKHLNFRQQTFYIVLLQLISKVAFKNHRGEHTFFFTLQLYDLCEVAFENHKDLF